MVHLLGALSLITCVSVALVNGYVFGAPFFQPQYPPALQTGYYSPQPLPPIAYSYGPWMNPWMAWKFNTFLPSSTQVPNVTPTTTAPVVVSQAAEDTPADQPDYLRPIAEVQPPSPWAPWLAWKKANFMPPPVYQPSAENAQSNFLPSPVYPPQAKEPENSAENALSSEEASPEGPLYRFPKAWYNEQIPD